MLESDIFSPFKVSNSGLVKLSEDIFSQSSSLYGQFNNASHTQNQVIELVQRINSYYSNLIEGGDTSPYSVDMAMQKYYADDSKERDLQKESLAHIRINRKIRLMSEKGDKFSPSSPEFLKWIHKEFYLDFPEGKEIYHDGLTETLYGGEFRKRAVKVGNHIAPDSKNLDYLMERFASIYKTTGSKVNNISMIPAAHHRLLYCHPFLDGNGRATRLYSEAMLYASKIAGAGLWSISRGLSRNVSEYKFQLQKADQVRMGALDGRGKLSEKYLIQFSEFFLHTMLDQAQYMATQFKFDHIKERIESYVNIVRSSDILAPNGKLTKLRSVVSKLLFEVFMRGEITRGEVRNITGFGDRLSTTIISELLKEGLLVATGKSHKSNIGIGLTTHFAINLFPDLYSEKYLHDNKTYLSNQSNHNQNSSIKPN